MNEGIFAPRLAKKLVFRLFFPKKVLKLTKSCKNEIFLQEMFAISLSSCSCYNAKFKCDQSVFAIRDSPLYFEISEDDHPPTTHGKR